MLSLIIGIFALYFYVAYCESTDEESDIFNGVDVDPIADDFEWAVWMSLSGNAHCSGSLISTQPTVILTAAHCVADLEWNEAANAWYYDGSEEIVRFDIGRKNIENGNVKGDAIVRLTLDVNSDIVYESNWEQARDIALVFIDISSLSASDKNDLMNIVVPNLAESDTNEYGCIEGEDLTVIGYGLIGPYIGASSLQGTVLECDIVNPLRLSSCVNRMQSNNIEYGELCYVGNLQTMTSTCAGDSGSPVMQGDMLNSDATRVIIGVNAWGGGSLGQCLPGPIKYSGGPNVAYWRQWIDFNIAGFASSNNKQLQLNIISNDNELQNLKNTNINRFSIIIICGIMIIMASMLMKKYTDNSKYNVYSIIADGAQETV